MVIVILGILSATALPKFIDLKSDAATAAAQAVAGGLRSASSSNYAGCVVAPTNVAKCTPLTVASTKKCSDIGTLLTPTLTFTVGALPTTTVSGTSYIVTDTALTTAGVTCTFVYGDGTANGITQTYTGYATS